MKSVTSRRSFLRMSGAAGLYGLTGCAGFPAIVSRRSPNSMLSHACVGVGGMGRADLEGLVSHEKIHITALCDVDSTFLMDALKLCPDARIYRNAHEMLEAEGDRIDSVNVSTPDHSHAGYVLDALNRGKNVYGQKPLCTTIKDCRRVAAMAAKRDVVTQMGTQIAAWECDRQTSEFIRSGTIGEVQHVWIFSNRGGQARASHEWPLKPSPVPETLDWKLRLDAAPYRPFVSGVYHPGTWRKWRDFGTSWLGDLGLHLLSPVWLGMDLGTTGPLAVTAKIPPESGEAVKQFWPRNSHITWEMPGVKASGGKPFVIEWCDGSIADRDARKKGVKDADRGFSSTALRLNDLSVVASEDPEFYPPALFKELYAKTPIGEQPLEGRVVEGTEGWLLSVHVGTPAVILKKSGKVLKAPEVGPAPTHWHEFINCCLEGGTPRSSFAWAGRMSEMVLIGNEAMSKPGVRIPWNCQTGTPVGEEWRA